MSPKEKKVRDWEDYKKSFKRGFYLLAIGTMTLIGLAGIIDRSSQDNSNQAIFGDQTNPYVEPSFEQESQDGLTDWQRNSKCVGGLLGLGLVSVGGPAALIELARKMAQINIK